MGEVTRTGGEAAYVKKLTLPPAWTGPPAIAPSALAMLVLLLMTSIAALVFIYFFMPTVWMSIMAVDQSLDAHEAGLALVAARNPFRESGPPVCMAKLIMLRHKMHQTNHRKRRSVSRTRHTPRTHGITPTRPKSSWIRFSRPFGKQHH